MASDPPARELMSMQMRRLEGVPAGCPNIQQLVANFYLFLHLLVSSTVLTPTT